MKNKLTFLIAPAILCCWCLFSITGCKDPVIKSKNLLTQSDTLNLAKDTLRLTVTTVAQQPLSSSGIIDGVLGSMNDRNLGISYGSFYAQCALTVSSPTFGTHPILDSVVLSLGFNGSYGPCTKPMNISVFELNEDLSSTANYHTNSSFNVKTPPIGQRLNYIPDFVDSVPVYVSGGNQAPQLRINLTKTFGYKLLNADSVSLLTDSLFKAYFKGIYVTASGPVGNGMIFCNLTSAASAVTIYYRNQDTGDTIENPFTFSLSGATVNHFDNNYFGAPVYNAIHSPLANNQKVYLEGGAGTQGQILINLDSLPKNIGVNKAELIVALSQPDSQYAAPSYLNLLRIDDAGVGQNLDDANSTIFGGGISGDTINGTLVYRYHFNISLYMQKLVQGIYNNHGLYLAIPGANSTPARAVLTNLPNDKIRRTYLTVTFTKL